VIGELRLGDCTQAEIAQDTGLSLPVVSRALGLLRALGLVKSGRGRSASHTLLARDELFAVLKAADRLAERINELRDVAQREAARQTVRDQLQGGTRTLRDEPADSS
jgi:DNA-binding IscR family transcriptional regulator